MTDQSNSDATVKEYMDAILSLEEEKAATNKLISGHKAALKGLGVEGKIVTKVIARMKKAREDVTEEDEAIDALEKRLGLDGLRW